MTNTENTKLAKANGREQAVGRSSGSRRGNRHRFSRHWVKLKSQVAKKNVFILSLILTYVLTIILTVGVAKIQMNQEREKEEDASGVSFYECANLNTTQFIAAKIMETIVPTTITFCATVLILQSDVGEKRTLTLSLFVAIAVLIVAGILLPTIKTVDNLMKYLWVLGGFCFIAIVLSWISFSDPQTKLPGHKNEPCDGKTVF